MFLNGSTDVAVARIKSVNEYPIMHLHQQATIAFPSVSAGATKAVIISGVLMFLLNLFKRQSNVYIPTYNDLQIKPISTFSTVPKLPQT